MMSMRQSASLFAWTLVLIALDNAKASPMGSSYRSGTLSPIDYLNHFQDHSTPFDINRSTAALNLDAPSHHQNLGSYYDTANHNEWHGYNQDRLVRHYPQEQDSLYISNHGHHGGRNEAEESELASQRVWHHQVDMYGNNQVFDDEGNLYQLDDFGNFYEVDDQGNLYLVEDPISLGLTSAGSNYAQYSPPPGTSASPAMSGIRNGDHPSPIFRASYHHVYPQRHQMPYGEEVYIEEGSGENEFYRTDPNPEFQQIGQIYGKEGMKVLHDNYRYQFENDPDITDQRADLDLQQGLTIHWAEQLYSGNPEKRQEAAERTYYLAGMYRARG